MLMSIYYRILYHLGFRNMKHDAEKQQQSELPNFLKTRSLDQSSGGSAPSPGAAVLEVTLRAEDRRSSHLLLFDSSRNGRRLSRGS